MNIETYLQEYYIQDYNLYKKFYGNCLCGRVVERYLREKDQRVTLHDEKLFFLVSYELNLLNQIFYSHFRRFSDEFNTKSLPFINVRCSNESQPQSIIRNVTQRSNRKVFYTREDILKADKYFYNYLEFLLEKGDFGEIKKAEVLHAISVDLDCNPETIIQYLKR